jgi:hypothetical protein
MKFINNINKYCYKSSRSIDNIKFNNGIEYSNSKHWYKNGLIHRGNDKPAIERLNGEKEWWVNGRFIKQNYDRNNIIHNDKFFYWD